MMILDVCCWMHMQRICLVNPWVETFNPPTFYIHVCLADFDTFLHRIAIANLLILLHKYHKLKGGPQIPMGVPWGPIKLHEAACTKWMGENLLHTIVVICKKESIKSDIWIHIYRCQQRCHNCCSKYNNKAKMHCERPQSTLLDCEQNSSRNRWRVLQIEQQQWSGKNCHINSWWQLYCWYL